ncbi:MAG: M23 family metallopeptidase [Campylobacterota bacterium]|nr:M23 family metallopeptidase [Campylobacterota bacterium]
MKFFLLLSLFFANLVAFDYSLSTSVTSNAKTVYIEFPKKRTLNYDKIIAGKRAYSIFSHPTNRDKMYAFIPISYYQKPTDKKVEVIYFENGIKKSETILLIVKEANYLKENLKVQSSKVNPKSKEVKKRTAKEYKEAMDIYGRATRKSYIETSFIMPMNSKITSDFGKARVYNGSLKGYHSGTDFRAKVGTPIIAVNDGVVVLAKDRFYAGNSIIIDHGHGIYSCYYHLSKFSVKEGERVTQKQIIGLSGATGRITGPHLHFSIRVGGLQVDPLQFIEIINKKIFKEN